jgi:hypothetical protein
LALAETCVNVNPTRRGESRAGKELAMDKDQADVNEAMDMPAHEKTYENFTAFMIFGIAFVAIVLVGMAIFLT